jgi:tRNA dimethylallyltransferase
MPSHEITTKSIDLNTGEAPQSSLIVIIGPTAVGKTEISIQLAERFNGEIISADSRLFYRGMDIGTAKPTSKDQERVPHHLIDVADPDQIWSLAIFKKEAQKAVRDIHSRGRLPFLVGGTGQYIRAVVEEWNIPEVRPDPRLRIVLEKWSNEITPKGLHNRLMVLDPEAAKRIDHRNVRRTIRALEVTLSTGRQFSVQRGKSTSPYRVLLIGLTRSRDEIFYRVDSRIQTMMENGLLEEVQTLLDRGYSPSLPTLSAIGYREISAHLRGEISFEEAIEQIKRKTRVFVRRQSNWFKSDDPDIRWFEVGPDTEYEIEVAIREWIS